jgi:hypothetical protein
VNQYLSRIVHLRVQTVATSPDARHRKTVETRPRQSLHVQISREGRPDGSSIVRPSVHERLYRRESKPRVIQREHNGELLSSRN